METIDPRGDIKAAQELSRVLAPGGTLLFVVPVGERAIIQFNAHRIYMKSMVTDMFQDLTLQSFAYISDPNLGPEKFTLEATEDDIAGNKYGCGCFCLKKIQKNKCNASYNE